MYSLILVASAIAGIFLLFNQAKFGRLPKGERLKRILLSPNYKNGSFQNQSHTPDLTEGATYFSVLKEFIFSKRPHRFPTDTIPSTKTNLHTLAVEENLLIWFGHSSYYMQVDGKRILVDPVLCGYASPFSFSTKAFKGTDIYKADDIPEIDILFLSHDHWDHLDHTTLVKLKPRIRKIICSLGTAAHLEHWGFDTSIIHEEDWNTTINLGDGFTVITTPARHFAGRAFRRNQALWTSFVLQSPSLKIFIGGDSGYDTHFSEIGKEHGPFDLAILENGQYDKSWKYIHMMPEEVLQAAVDLNARMLFPVHSSKFSIANHSWDAPLKTIARLNDGGKISMITPMIGEKVLLNKEQQRYKEWWKDVK